MFERRKHLMLAAMLICAGPAAAQTQETVPPSATPAASFRAQGNAIEFADRDSLAGLGRKWTAAEAPRIAIAHFGDSLVQNGKLPGAARARLQALRGVGGRGMVFPYAVAKSYDQEDYSSAFTGEWDSANSMQQPPRMPVGLSGFVGRTRSAAASFTFDFSPRLDPGAKRVRLLYRTPLAHYRLVVTGGSERFERDLPAQQPDGRTQFLDFEFEKIGSTLNFVLERLDAPVADAAPAVDALAGGAIAAAFDPGCFELYGVDIENEGGGLTYHDLGVGGAAFSALDDQLLFREQASAIAPDLVILDWGTNDLIYKDRVDPGLEPLVLRTIAKVRAAWPDAAILLTSTGDVDYRGRNVQATRAFAALMRRIALANDCLFWDWYRIAGGQGARATLAAAGLSARDNIHLSSEGYALKGGLLAEALVTTLDRYAQGAPQLVVATD